MRKLSRGATLSPATGRAETCGAMSSEDPPNGGAPSPGRLVGGDRNSTKARVYVEERDGRRVAVKTSVGAGFVARWLLRRESRIFASLPLLGCVPRVLETRPDGGSWARTFSARAVAAPPTTRSKAAPPITVPSACGCMGRLFRKPRASAPAAATVEVARTSRTAA